MTSLLPPRRATIRLLQRAAVLRHPPPLLRCIQARPVHQTAALSLPHKDDQDRQSLKPRAAENTRSGSTDDVAHQDTAFNPSSTRPEEAIEEAEKEAARDRTGGNPLEFSGANKDVARARPESDPPGQGVEDKKTKSGGGSGQKHGQVAP